MSVLLFAFETRPGGCNAFIGMQHSLSMSSKDACALGFMDCVVTISDLPLVSEINVSLKPFIGSIFRDIGMISLYIVSESILCTGMMTRLCKNAFFFLTICCL